MSIQVKRSFTIAASVERVGRTICSEAYALEGAKSRDNVVSTTHRVIREDENRLEYEIANVEYARSKTGKIDRGKTDNTKTRGLLDLGARTLSWTFSTDSSDRVKLEGLYRFTPRGDATHVDFELTVDVRIPLIGNKIAKMIAKGYEEAFPDVQARIERHATGGQ